jgi:hypothetical protein
MLQNRASVTVAARNAAGIVLAGVLLSGCSALHSVRHDDDRLAPGLGYYLPNGDFKVTMTVAQGASGLTHSFKVETLYYPDVGERYSVTVPKNPLGATEANIQVSKAGLLQSVTYTYEPQILQAMDAIAPVIPALPLSELAKSKGCAEPGDYVAILAPGNGSTTLCGYTLVATSLGLPAQTEAGRSTAVATQPGSTYRPGGDEQRNARPAGRGPTNGLYFRMNLPYRIDVRSGSGDPVRTVYSDIALSPTGASTLFVQTHRSLFATVSGSIVFDHGVLVSFAPKSSSEVETAFKIPARVIKAYFDAVNALFVLRKGEADSEAQYMGALENMRKSKADLEACKAAHATGQQSQIDAICGAGTSGD